MYFTLFNNVDIEKGKSLFTHQEKKRHTEEQWYALLGVWKPALFVCFGESEHETIIKGYGIIGMCVHEFEYVILRPSQPKNKKWYHIRKVYKVLQLHCFAYQNEKYIFIAIVIVTVRELAI